MNTTYPFKFNTSAITFIGLFIVFFLISSSVKSQVSNDSIDTGNRDFITDLFHQVNNPVASNMQIQYAYNFYPNFYILNSPASSFSIQPTIPIGPFQSFPFVQSIRITYSYTSIPAPINEYGSNDFQIYDLLIIKKKWGKWGIGPVFVFPTASDSNTDLGAGKWQVGPAFTIVHTGHKNFTIGALLLNPISFAGDPERPNVNSLIFQPILTCNLKNGFFIGFSDYNWTFSWIEGGETTIPAGLQLGRVFNLKKHAISFSAEAAKLVAYPATIYDPGWFYAFEFTQLFNWHIGPKKIIH